MQEVTVSLDNPSAQALATALSQRQRAHAYTDIRRYKQLLMHQGTAVDDKDYLQFWRDLQSSGAGKIVYSKRGRPTKFAWARDLKSVARQLKLKTQSTMPSVTTQSRVIIALGAGRQAELYLPAGLSIAETEKIASVVLGLVVP